MTIDEALAIQADVLRESASAVLGTLGGHGPAIREFEDLVGRVQSEFAGDAERVLGREASGQCPTAPPRTPAERPPWSEVRVLQLPSLPEPVSYCASWSRDVPRRRGGSGEKHLSVIMPTSGSPETATAALARLAVETDRLPADYSWELTACLNNVRTRTLGAVLAFKAEYPRPLNVIELLTPLPHAGKLAAENAAFHLLLERYARCFGPGAASGVYFHIADDDITYLPGGDVPALCLNVQELDEHPSLRYVSGTYSTRPTAVRTAFHFRNAIRKAPSLLATCGPLPFPYGGCVTLRDADFPLGGVPLDWGALDYYLPLATLDDMITRHGAASGGSAVTPQCLPARTNPRFLVGHDEPRTFGQFAHRFLRDEEWLAGCAGLLDSRTLPEFKRLRALAFAPIGAAIESLPEADPRRLGHQWMTAIRANLRALRKQGLHSTDFAGTWIDTD